MSKKLQNFRNLIVFIPTFFVFYASIAHLGGFTTSKKEIFPFFNWSLFTYVSDSRNLIEVEVLAIGGKELNSPTRFFELDNFFRAAKGRNATVKKLLERIYSAKVRGEDEEFENLRGVLESNYLSDQSAIAYQLVLVSYNPIDRWKNGTVTFKKVLGTYRTKGLSD